MKIGLILPTFRDSVGDALDVAVAAHEAGLDGVFAYDHLWPMGSPTRPSFAPFPVLARAAVLCPGLWVGPLVARVGMVSTAHLAGQFRALATLAPGRVIVALGTGDSSTRDELDAYDLPFASSEARRQLVREVARAVGDVGPVWVGAGGGAVQTEAIAHELGAEVNLWQSPVTAVARLATSGPVNWAGEVSGDLTSNLDALAAAGATWAILRPGTSVEQLATWVRLQTL